MPKNRTVLNLQFGPNVAVCSVTDVGGKLIGNLTCQYIGNTKISEVYQEVKHD